MWLTQQCVAMDVNHAYIESALLQCCVPAGMLHTAWLFTNKCVVVWCTVAVDPAFVGIFSGAVYGDTVGVFCVFTRLLRGPQVPSVIQCVLRNARRPNVIYQCSCCLGYAVQTELSLQRGQCFVKVYAQLKTAWMKEVAKGQQHRL